MIINKFSSQAAPVLKQRFCNDRKTNLASIEKYFDGSTTGLKDVDSSDHQEQPEGGVRGTVAGKRQNKVSRPDHPIPTTPRQSGKQ